ncbi:putative tetratricopeptide-like helical domain superfamily [Helianthus anomalus]
MDLCAISVLRCTVVFNLTKIGFNSHIYTATALTDMSMKFKYQFLYSALKVFDEITEPNTTSVNVVVSGFCQNGCYKKAFEVFKRFSEFKLRPDSVTVASLLPGCDVSVKDGQQVHCWAVKIGVETDIYVATSLVTMYFNCKQPLTASIVFKRIGRKTVACCNAYVTGLLHNRIVEPVFKL